MTDAYADALIDLVDGEASTPFATAVLRSNRAKGPFSDALHAGATNLLRKALVALMKGDEARTEALVARVAALPFDDHEGVYPGLSMASFLVFETVVNEFEASDEGEEYWLDAALTARASSDPAGAEMLSLALDVVRKDYEVTPHEMRRINAAVGADVPDDRDIEARLGDDRSAHARAIMSALRANHAYLEAIVAALPED